MSDLHVLEEPKVDELLASLVDHDLVVSITFGNTKLAPDDIVFGPVVAHNIDAFDVNARALFNDEDERDGSFNRVALNPGADLAEGVTLLGNSHSQRFRRLIHEVRVIDITRMGEQTAAHRLRR